MIRHLFGLLFFLVIVFGSLFVDVADKIPVINSRLPMRYVITAKTDLDLYALHSEGGELSAVGVLKSGETADFEAWVCPYKLIKLSDGKRYYVRAEEDRNEIEIRRLKFYYF